MAGLSNGVKTQRGDFPGNRLSSALAKIGSRFSREIRERK
jgi:hypothetical protein